MNGMKKSILYHLNKNTSLNEDDDEKHILIKEVISEIDNDHSSSCLRYIIDLIFNAFFVTPLSILFYTSTWDIFEDYFGTKFFYFRLLAIFIICNFTLLFIYLFQYKIQSYHDHLKQNSNSKYYGRDFYFRCLFTYILSLAYNLQWITYWDLYDNLASHVHYIYCLTLALVSLIVYRFILNRNTYSLTRTVPFHLEKDSDFETYFLQDKLIRLENQDNKVILNITF
jgi:hypothetical protein